MRARWVLASLTVLWILVGLSIQVQLRGNTTATRVLVAGGHWAGKPVAVLGCAQAPCTKGP